jgi:hypothetical protein
MQEIVRVAKCRAGAKNNNDINNNMNTVFMTHLNLHRYHGEGYNFDISAIGNRIELNQTQFQNIEKILLKMVNRIDFVLKNSA